MANIISWNGDATGLTTVSSDFTDSNGQVIHTVFVKISDKMPNLEGAIISGVFQGNNVSNWVISSDEILSDNGVYNAESQNAGAVSVVTEANASLDGVTFSEKGTYVGYSASTGSASISFWSNISIEYSSELVKSATFPIPEAYRPYVNFAKKVYEQAYGLDVPYGKLAVAENEQYIAVHFLEDNFRLVSYDADTTEYTATGISFIAYDKKNDVYDSTPTDNRTTTSEAGRFINNWVWSEVDVTWDGETVFTTQEGWYYNAVKLPCIDGVWDKTKYPYANITKLGSTIALLLSTNRMYTDSSDNLLFKVSSDYILYTYSESSSEWTKSEEASDVTNPNGILAYITWSNHNILYEDGTVAFPASDPVHVTMDVPAAYDPISFQIGLAFGLCGKGIPEDLQVVGGGISGTYTWNAKDGYLDTKTVTDGESSMTIHKIFDVAPTSEQIIGATLVGATVSEIINENMLDGCEDGDGCYTLYGMLLFIYDANNIFDAPTGTWLLDVYADSFAEESPVSLIIP